MISRPYLSRYAAWLCLAAAACAQAKPGPEGLEDPQRLARSVEDYLQAQLAQTPGEAKISIDPMRTANLPACDVLQPFLPSALRLRPRISVGVRCASPQAWTTYVQANLSIAGHYYVAARRISPGRVIDADDLATRPADLVTLPPGVVTDASRAIGLRAAHRIAAGQTIKGASLRNPQSVERGQSVRLVANGPGFVINSEGEALNDAAPGTRVQVRTPSGQIVSGVVQNAGLVEIPL